MRIICPVVSVLLVAMGGVRSAGRARKAIDFLEVISLPLQILWVLELLFERTHPVRTLVCI